MWSSPLSFEIVTEIRLARTCLASFSYHDRRRLLRRIVEALDAIHDHATASGLISDPAGIDRVIISTSQSIGQIAQLTDNEFRVVIEEFDTLFRKLSQTVLEHAPPISAAFH